MSTQTWDPEVYARNARFVSDLGMPVVELLAPQAGERILDLGCGNRRADGQARRAGLPGGRRWTATPNRWRPRSGWAWISA